MVLRADFVQNRYASSDQWTKVKSIADQVESHLKTPYRPDEFTGVLAERNLREKLANRDFRHDLDPLLAVGVASDYNIDEAGGLIIRELLSQLDT
jgi:hypothetical protein